MNNIGNIELVYSLFNQYLFQEAKNNIDLVDLYYRTNPATLGNGLVSDLIDSIRKYPLESIDEPLFRSILVKQGKTSKESDEILKSIIKYKMYDNKAIDPARKYLRGICSSSIIKMAENKFQNDPEGFIKYLKNSDYKSDYSDLMSIETPAGRAHGAHPFFHHRRPAAVHPHGQPVPQHDHHGQRRPACGS